MQGVNVLGVSNPMQFPDDMDKDDIREFLRRRFAKQAVEGTQPVDINPLQAQAQATEQSLAEKAGQGISNALYDSGIISDRYGAQRIGDNATALGEFLPVIGDATAGDEFGRALKQGDGVGMALGVVGAVPIAGDIAKKALRKLKNVTLPSGRLGADEFKFIKQSDPSAKAMTKEELEAAGFDTGAIFRHDPAYRYPNPNTDPILEILEDSDETSFDGIFANQDYFDDDDIRNNDFFVKNRALHSDFNNSFYEDIKKTREIISGEMYAYDELSLEQKELIDDLITEEASNLYDYASEGDIELPEWITEAFSENDIGMIEWEIQRIRGQVAKSMGYDAVDMKDETGTATLLLSSDGVVNIKAAFDGLY